MVNVTSKWNGAEAYKFVIDAGMGGIIRATEFLYGHLLQVLSVSNPRPYTTPSAPGEPPRLRTGFLRKNVVREYDHANLSSRVGVTENAFYGAILELYMNRPWLLVTVQRLMPQLQALFKSET